MRFIDPIKFIEKLKSKEKPPQAYEDNKALIESETRLLEFRCVVENRDPSEEEIAHIVNLKLNSDTILGNWIEGTSSDFHT